MPGVVNAGTDAFKRSDPGSARMPTPEDRVGELGMLLNMCRDDVQNWYSTYESTFNTAKGHMWPV